MNTITSETSELTFHSFHNIENCKQKLINNLITLPCYIEEWIVLEKVHGCNFSFTTNGIDVIMGKRNSFLMNESEEQAFHKSNIYMRKYFEVVKQIFEYLNLIQGKDVLVIYGELFGGYYPDFPKTTKPIQRGVYYCPNYEFYAFDIRINENYTNYDKCVEIFEKFNMIYAHVLMRGTFEECYKWSLENKNTNTTIPLLFGLQDIPDNIREGNIIKPVNPTYYKNTFIIFKDKNTKFEENQKSFVKTNGSTFNQIEQYQQELLSYINQQRLDNVISKINPIDVIVEDKKYIPILMKEFTNDVVKEFYKEHDDISFSTEPDIKHLINKFVSNHVKPLVIQIF